MSDEERRRRRRKNIGQQSERDWERDAERRADVDRQIEEEGGLLEIGGDNTTAAEEASFLNSRTLWISLIGLVVLIGVVLAISALLFGYFTSTREPGVVQQEVAPPGPRVLPDPAAPLDVLRATEQANLNSYGWVDRDAGVVRIPIERAMEIIAGQGLPVAEGSAGRSGPGQADESGFGQATVVPDDPAALAEAGAQVYQQLGCGGCHTEESTSTAPTLIGLYGEEEQLADGSTVTVDEAYLQDSILNPQAQIVEGYQPIMPSYAGRITDQQLAALIAYLQSLGEDGS